MKNHKMRRVTRIGAYGMALHENKILLVHKKPIGYYNGLLDLPGGGIEFGESPEEALKREFVEEVTLQIQSMEWLSNLSHRGIATHLDEPFDFHHLGLIYRVNQWSEVKLAIPEETFAWYPLDELAPQALTPFAREILTAEFSKLQNR